MLRFEVCLQKSGMPVPLVLTNPGHGTDAGRLCVDQEGNAPSPAGK
jgi:hypothetical protein